MKLREGMFAWNANSDEVEAGPWPDKAGWSNRYQMTGGGCYAEVRTYSPAEAKALLFIEAIVLIVRDNVDPMAVHQAFLAFDEYRAGLPDDMPT